ncbi:MAG: hypothetical protein U1A77_11050 [Pirellulales bacterium]
MSSLKTIDRQPFEDLLGMSSGYVLDFSDATFASFFAESVRRNIHDDPYTKYGGSKAKKLRAFWDVESDALVGKTLGELVDLWEYKNPDASDKDKATAKRCRDIIARLLGKAAAPAPEITEEQFLNRDFSEVSIGKVPIEASLIPILESRFQEAVRSLKAKCPLSAIFMSGSVLEGLLLGMALANPRIFNQAASAPKDSSGKSKQFPEWTLAQMIDVSCELGYLKIDVKKFGHALRDFRNYIHPYQQMSSRFAPDEHTAAICIQVLRAAIASLGGNRN